MRALRFAAVALLGLALAGCAWLEEVASDPDRSAALRDALSAQVLAYNSAGIDPLQLSGKQLTIATLACSTLSILPAVISPDVAPIGAEVLAWCDPLLQALGPAAPLHALDPAISPLPPPKPPA